jgi:hypothetical protein
MRFCPNSNCHGLLTREPEGDKIIFRCRFCDTEVPGDAWDACIEGGVIGREQTDEMYRNLLKYAPTDRVNQLVDRECKVCWLPYMTLVRVGADETVIFRCECGATESDDTSARALAGKSASSPAGNSASSPAVASPRP